MKMKDAFYNLSIKSKITYLYLPLAIIPVIVFALFSYNMYENTIVNRSLGSMEDNNILIQNQIEDVLEDMESCATLLTISINNLYRNEALSAKPVVDVLFDNSISNELAYSRLIFKDIDAISYIDKDLKIYYTDERLTDNYFLVPESKVLDEIKESTGNNIWFDVTRRGYLTRSSDQAVVTLGKKIWNIDTGETLGYLFINVDQTSFSKLFEVQHTKHYLVNQEHKIVSSSKQDLVLKTLPTGVLSTFIIAEESLAVMEEDVSKFMMSKTSLSRMNWTLLSEADLDDFTQDLSNLLLLIGIILVTLIALEISMSLLLNNLITDPIQKLRMGIEKVSQGDFDVRFKMKTKDEIGVFAESFNYMSVRIKELLHQVEEEEEKKREYELALIQQQIKPHFLYNTLDIILKLSQMGQNKKAQKATRRLADYYKSSLSGGEDIISIEKELKITKDYLELQKIRYSDLFTYEIEVEDALLDMVIPKLTLQPLVENAIYHGLKYKETFGHILIKGRVEGQEWILSVIDDGVGLNPETLEKITEKRDGHFGLYNVNHRLMLFSNAQCRLEYRSELDVYTEARVVYEKKAVKSC